MPTLYPCSALSAHGSSSLLGMAGGMALVPPLTFCTLRIFLSRKSAQSNHREHLRGCGRRIKAARTTLGAPSVRPCSSSHRSFLSSSLKSRSLWLKISCVVFELSFVTVMNDFYGKPPRRQLFVVFGGGFDRFGR